MEKKQFQIDAVCTSRHCESREFSVLRSQVVKTASDGHEFTISKVVCPTCRMWADVMGIKEITP